MATHDPVYGGLEKIRLNQYTLVHWVNEDSCLLQIEINGGSNCRANAEQFLVDENAMVLAWVDALTTPSPPAWLNNYVPAYTSLLIVHDRDVADKFAVLAFFKALAKSPALRDLKTDPNEGNRHSRQSHLQQSAQSHSIEVCYSLELEQRLHAQGYLKNAMPNDLLAVSQYTGQSVDSIVALHSKSKYRVFTVGFLPNFAYMGLTAAAISTPRLTTPRKRVPAGAVAIADNQTAIYPQASPGGWHIIGYTPVYLGVGAATQFVAGDSVEFVPISTQVFCDRYSARD
jgi:KipI family sensor histidine kinase inhibitor